MVELLHELDRLLDRIPVLSLARVVGEVLELELHRAVLGQYGRGARPAGELALVAAVERDRRARQAGAMLGEGVEELVGELGRLGEEDLLARELEGREQPAEYADDGLEHGDTRRLVEVQVLLDPRLRAPELLLHTEDPQVVEAVDQRRAQPEPVVRAIAHRLELVHAPRVPLVRSPRALEDVAHVLAPYAGERVRGVDLLGARSLPRRPLLRAHPLERPLAPGDVAARDVLHRDQLELLPVLGRVLEPEPARRLHARGDTQADALLPAVGEGLKVDATLACLRGLRLP
mmetsp:Transcript_20471/g.51895  ORF Transcript_20471/g.51895 Transcript_20471/m.51895 type:complete len:289 (+) Transcript_20471:973-1839(+)